MMSVLLFSHANSTVLGVSLLTTLLFSFFFQARPSPCLSHPCLRPNFWRTPLPQVLQPALPQQLNGIVHTVEWNRTAAKTSLAKNTSCASHSVQHRVSHASHSVIKLGHKLCQVRQEAAQGSAVLLKLCSAAAAVQGSCVQWTTELCCRCAALSPRLQQQHGRSLKDKPGPVTSLRRGTPSWLGQSVRRAAWASAGCGTAGPAPAACCGTGNWEWVI